MARINAFLLSLPGGAPVWESLSEGKRAACSAPGERERTPVIALIPERLVFLFQGMDSQGKKARNLRTATKLQMGHLFPPCDAPDQGATTSGAGRVLGFTVHPDLRETIEAHSDDLSLASIITTPFLVALAHAEERDMNTWIFDGGDGSKALVLPDTIFYFNGGEEELARRLEESGLDAEPRRITLDQALASLAEGNFKAAGIKLPLRTATTCQEADLRALGQSLAAVALIGFLFIAGQALRVMDAASASTDLKAALKTEYTKVLGKDHGGDPFGKLLYRLESIKGGAASGIDAVDLMTTLSVHSPPGIVVDAITMSKDSGNIRASAPTFADVDALMANLASVRNYDFTLDQAAASGNAVQLKLKVEIRRL